MSGVAKKRQKGREHENTMGVLQCHVSILKLES